MTDSTKFEAEVSIDQKNVNNIHCQYCNSLILKPEMGVFINNTEFKLPLIHQKNTKNLSEIEYEVFKDFWVVDDMFTFENIGFSNTVDQTKFLICADCEMGPIGYHDVASKKNYISLSRVKHSALG